MDYDALAKQAGAISSAPPDYDALAKQAGAVSSAPPASAVSRYFSGLGQELNPANLVRSLDQAVYHPIDTARALIGAQAHVADEAVDSFKQGHYADAAKHGLLYMLPMVGPQVDDISNQAVGGDLAGALGRATGQGLMMAAPESPIVRGAAGATVDALKAAPTQIAQRVLSGAVKPSLDASEASAVAYGRAAGVHMPVSVQTGSKVAANAEKILEHVPLGPAAIAAESRAAGKQTLAAAGANEVAGLQPGAATVADPLEAGTAIHSALDAKIAGHISDANDAYNALRSIEAQPQFAAEVQTGTKRVLDPDNVDEAGNPVYKTVPVTETIQLPVDLRPVKSALKPIYDRMMRQMPVAQQQASAGLKALDNVVNGPDFESASISDENLGAIKQIARETNSPIGQGLAKAAVKQLDQAVTNTVARAGPDALDALQRGRAATVAKYDVQGLKDSLPAEPVQLANKLTADGDRNVNLLKSIAVHAPDQMPALGQAYVQGLLDKVTADAGMGKPTTALSSWRKMGDATKQVLFQDPATIDRLDNFFTLAKKMGENPNPSGSGTLLAMGKTGMLLLTQPHIGIPLVLGSRAAARMLFNPETSALMSAALKMPAASKGAALLGSQLAKAATAAGAQGSLFPTAEAEPAAPEAEAAAPSSSAAPAAAAPAAASPDTVITVPGEPNNSYKAQYKLKELADVQASHNGLTFQRNPNYELENDRNYDNAVNQGKVIGWSSRGI